MMVILVSFGLEFNKTLQQFVHLNLSKSLIKNIFYKTEYAWHQNIAVS